MRRIVKIRRRRRAAKDDCLKSAPLLKPGHIYALPDGRKLVLEADGDGYLLYHPLVWGGLPWVSSCPIEYEIDAHGRILTSTGQPTPWRAEDLRELGTAVENSERSALR
ncbi:hypothetical protein [Pyrinomonas methylaliphatogenes]|uniref:Uncharacterized protein n=1 Tax=Pyrinomonas methylaliphatogenes TaxID=454194 RepID=A0A0B6WYG8_9BACT|nr:hypothetical protein [Pyrinomonas methylaliphatogenes]CDM65190.1 hypothetical protein PYK22_01188 [Pyrinomonas methylaliphatogenes]